MDILANLNPPQRVWLWNMDAARRWFSPAPEAAKPASSRTGSHTWYRTAASSGEYSGGHVYQ